MISAITQNLQRGVCLLNSVSDEVYSDGSVAPYYSSIGIHMRHILDVYDCIFDGIDSGNINLINRKRNAMAEEKVDFGLAYFDVIIKKLHDLKGKDLSFMVKVTDDLGSGEITADYTLASVLIQAHSHTTHHFASIGYIIAQLGIDLPDSDFGYNPTTPKNKDLRT